MHMNSMTPSISIIVPLYNKEHTIRNTLETVLTQSYTDYEIIVINDGSTDQSAAKVAEINDNRINLVCQSNAGVSSARNNGIMRAKGKWILFLDADDTLMPDALKTFMDNIIDDETIVAANFLVKTPTEQYKFLPVKKSGIYNHAEIYKAWAFKRLFLRTGSFIIPTDIAQKEPYNESLLRFEDLDFLFRSFSHARIKFIPDIVMAYETSFADASKINQQKWDKDYLFYLRFTSKQFWKNCVYGDCLNIALNSYPAKQKELESLYAGNLKYAIIAKIINYSTLLNKKGIKKCRKKIILFFKKCNPWSK